jgi:hypothetical protein
LGLLRELEASLGDAAARASEPLARLRERIEALAEAADRARDGGAH